MDNSISAHYPDRVRVLITLDLAEARRLMTTQGQDISHLSDQGIILGMHKARLHVPAVPLHLRQESLALLKSLEFRDIYGDPLPERIEE